MKITYISSFDASDITSYSGTGYFIPHKLQEAGNTISYIGKLSEINPFSQKIKRRLYAMLGKKYLIERNPGVLKQWARYTEKIIDPSTQVLLGYSSQPFSRLNTSKPKVFWTDAVFASMIDYYEVYSNLCQESIKDGNRMEHDAIHNASLAVYSSQWAADAAIKYYGADKSKVRVVPYGANIDVDFSDQDIIKRAEQKSFRECHLLFLGVEWHRKGGDKAVEITEYLNQQGINTTLSIIGVQPPEPVRNLPFVRSYGFISKSTNEGLKQINKIISDSHFLLLPTRADCTPIVFSELNAHGIPVITTNEGGIPSLITQGVNGFRFDKDSPAKVFAEKITDCFHNQKEYIRLSQSSFDEFKTRLNWNHSIKEFQKILREVI